MPRFVTPLDATHRVRIHYVSDGLSHSVDYLCKAVIAAVTPSGFKFVTYQGDTIEVDAGVQALALVLADILPPAANIVTYELQEYAAGSYNPVWQNGIGVAGTNSATRSKANRLTYVFRDDLFKPVKSVILGVAGPSPQHDSIASLSGPFGAYATELLNTAVGHTGDWLSGRAAQRLRSGVNYTVSDDRKSRRRLGLV